MAFNSHRSDMTTALDLIAASAGPARDHLVDRASAQWHGTPGEAVSCLWNALAMIVTIAADLAATQAGAPVQTHPCTQSIEFFNEVAPTTLSDSQSPLTKRVLAGVATALQEAAGEVSVEQCTQYLDATLKLMITDGSFASNGTVKDLVSATALAGQPLVDACALASVATVSELLSLAYGQLKQAGGGSD